MIRVDIDLPELRLGLVRGLGVRVTPSAPALEDLMRAAEEAVRADPSCFPEPTRAAIRDLLRHGGYKPTGRGKPASEFLLGAALSEAGTPRVNNLVDINNLASLQSAHPISMFDADRLGDMPSIRHGREGESYVFNVSGQRMDLKDLLVVCRGAESEPIGNPVKDSMLGKVHPETRNVFAVIYGSNRVPARDLERACTKLAELLKEHAGAAHVTHTVVP